MKDLPINRRRLRPQSAREMLLSFAIIQPSFWILVVNGVDLRKFGSLSLDLNTARLFPHEISQASLREQADVACGASARRIEALQDRSPIAVERHEDQVDQVGFFVGTDLANAPPMELAANADANSRQHPTLIAN